KEAEAAYRDALAIIKKVTEEIPLRYQCYVVMVTGQCDLAVMLVKAGKLQEAATACTDAVATHRQLMELFPQNRSIAGGMFWRYRLHAQVELACSNGDAADNVCKEALRFGEKLDPLDRSFALFLLTCPVPKFRDVQRALQMLEKALTRAPNDAFL